MEEMIVFEIAGSGKRINQGERRRRALDHRDCNSAVQRHNRRGLHPFEKIVKADDLAPIRIFSTCRLAMQCCDRRLKRERPELSAERFLDERQGFSDLLLIPAATILFFEKDQVAGFIDACIAPKLYSSIRSGVAPRLADASSSVTLVC